MAEIDLGKIAPIGKGDYISSNTYENLDIVRELGISYIATTDVNINENPSAFPLKWKVLNKDGVNTNPITGNAYENNAPSNDNSVFKSYKVVEPISTSSAWYTAASATEKLKFPILQDALDANSIFFDVTNGVVSVFMQPILKPYGVFDINEGIFGIADEDGNIALKIDENGKTSFIQDEDNLKENLLSVGIDSNNIGGIISGVGSAGVFYFCDEYGYVSSKINADGSFETASLGQVMQNLISNISKNILSTNGNKLADYNGIATYGQSLSVGQTERIISATQSNARLLNLDGVTRTSAYDKSLTGDTYPTNRRLTFKPLVERVNDGTSAGILRETPSTGTGEMFAKSYSETLFNALDKNIIVTAPGWGATSISQLSKGTGYYMQLINDVTASKTIANSLGKTYRFLAVTWTQGESDYLGSTTKATYKSLLNQLILDLNTDIKAITGQIEDVVLVTYQTATAKNAGVDYPNIALAQFECSQENPLIFMALPMYQMIYNDGFHIKSLSSKTLGVYYGDVINRIIMKGEDYKPLHIRGKSVVGNVITLTYHLPDNGELSFDTVNGLNLTNKGFSFSDNSNIITSVVIGTDKQSIVITCSSNPAGKTLQYATTPQTITGTQANLGNVRDNSGEKRSFIIEGNSIKLHNYAIIQEITL